MHFKIMEHYDDTYFRIKKFWKEFSRIFKSFYWLKETMRLMMSLLINVTQRKNTKLM